MELLVGALQESKFAEETEFGLGRKRDMNAGGVIDLAQLDQTSGQNPAELVGARTRPHQQPASGRRRERNGNLQFRVVVAAGVRVGLGPAGVEHVFTA